MSLSATEWLWTTVELQIRLWLHIYTIIHSLLVLAFQLDLLTQHLKYRQPYPLTSFYKKRNGDLCQFGLEFFHRILSKQHFGVQICFCFWHSCFIRFQRLTSSILYTRMVKTNLSHCKNKFTPGGTKKTKKEEC